LKETQETFTLNVISVLSSRATLDPLRLLATGTLLDLHTLFATLRPTKKSKSKSGNAAIDIDENNKYEYLQSLIKEITPEVRNELASIFNAAEKQYAKRAKKSLAAPGDDEEPEDVDSEPEDDEDEDATDSEKRSDILKAEQQLCELTGKLVLAILAEVIDASGPLKGKLCTRIQRNRTKLDHNFKEVVAYLDNPKTKGNRSHKSKEQQAADAAKKAAKSVELVEVEEEEEEDLLEEVEPDEGTVEDLRRRGLLDEDGQNGEAAGGEDDEILGD